MALFKHASFFQQDDSAAFDDTYHPGQATPHSGIYRCVVCGFEVTSEKVSPLPTQSHGVHNARLQPIRWRLIAAAHHKAA
jgi:hypothetical protein